MHCPAERRYEERISAITNGDTNENMSHSIQDLDDIDWQILAALTTDARNTSSPEIAEKVDVTPATIRNRIENLVSAGVIESHRSEINYRSLGLLEFLFVCSTTPDRFGEITDQLAAVPEIIQIRELLSGSHNLHIVAVVETQDHAESLERRLLDMDLEIETVSLVSNDHRPPYSAHEAFESAGEDNR